MWANPQAFKDAVYGKSIDMDNAYGAQCWDLFDFYCTQQGVTCSRYCALTGYAGDLYKLRYKYGYDKFFDFFYPKNAKRGDWYFSDHHVAMVWDVYDDGTALLLGQNQSGIKKVTLKKYKLSDALGMMRWRKWMDGWQKENGKWYYYINGKKTTGWKKIAYKGKDCWFFFDSDGVMITGWRLITYKGKKEWFWFDDKGVMAENILRWVKNNWYYFDADGVMVTGEIELTLEFDSSGRLIGGKK